VIFDPVVRSSFTAFTCLLIHKSNWLKARVIISAYNQHVRLLPPEPVVVEQPQSTRVQGADIVMQSFGPAEERTSDNPVLSGVDEDLGAVSTSISQFSFRLRRKRASPGTLVSVGAKVTLY
jgi:hypothetical protein